jgi:L-malate glycosyltransferase
VLTVLLATRNRGVVFREVLEAFCQLQLPQSGWKLLVVDNGSTDATPQVIASFAKRLPLHSVTEGKQGKNFALNTGLGLIEGDLTILTDDDVFPREDWLIQFRNAADAHREFSIFGGAIVPHWETPPPPWIGWADKGAAFAITDPSWQGGPIPANCIWGPNMAIRSDIFRSGIRFDTSIGPLGAKYAQGGDTEMTRRLETLGHRAWHVPGAVVGHFIRKEQMDKSWVLRRAIRHGRGEFRLGQADEIVSRKLLLGSPRYLYRKLYKEAREMAVSWIMQRKGDYFQSCWRFNFVRGQIQEARALSKERKP